MKKIDQLSTPAKSKLSREANDPRQLKARFAYNKSLTMRLMAFAKEAHPVDAPASSLPNVLRYISENISRGKPVDKWCLASFCEL